MLLSDTDTSKYLVVIDLAHKAKKLIDTEVIEVQEQAQLFLGDAMHMAGRIGKVELRQKAFDDIKRIMDEKS